MVTSVDDIREDLSLWFALFTFQRFRFCNGSSLGVGEPIFLSRAGCWTTYVKICKRGYHSVYTHEPDHMTMIKRKVLIFMTCIIHDT